MNIMTPASSASLAAGSWMRLCGALTEIHYNLPLLCSSEGAWHQQTALPSLTVFNLWKVLWKNSWSPEDERSPMSLFLRSCSSDLSSLWPWFLPDWPTMGLAPIVRLQSLHPTNTASSHVLSFEDGSCFLLLLISVLPHCTLFGHFLGYHLHKQFLLLNLPY